VEAATILEAREVSFDVAEDETEISLPYLEFDVTLQLAEVLELARLYVAFWRVLSEFRQLPFVAGHHQLVLADLFPLHSARCHGYCRYF